MATYTMQLREYIEQATQYEEGLSINEKIEIGRKKLFDFNYPIFDSEFKKVFETNFIKNFYMREIGFETEGLFKMRLETWLNINMPYFNDLLESELLEYDPLTNAQMTTAHERVNDRSRDDKRSISRKSETDRTVDSTSGQTTNSTGQVIDDGFSRNVSSDTPDSRLRLQTKQGKGVIEYASEIDENKIDNKSDSKSNTKSNLDSQDKTRADSKSNQSDDMNRTENDLEHYLQRRYGKVGADSYPKLVQDYRKALLRIERMIHKEMQELFMLVY